MAFNKINSNTDKFTYLDGQSTVLRTIDTNEINIHGVNVITKTPTKGDVLCITRKRNSSDVLLGPENQDIVWIKGMTIDYMSFPSTLYEPIGIVYKVRGRIAYVKYRYDISTQFSNVYRLTTNLKTTTTGTYNVDISLALQYVDSTGMYRTKQIYKLSNKSISITGTFGVALSKLADSLNNIFVTGNGMNEIAEYRGKVSVSAEYKEGFLNDSGLNINDEEVDSGGRIIVNVAFDDKIFNTISCTKVSCNGTINKTGTSGEGNTIATMDISFIDNISDNDKVKLNNDKIYEFSEYNGTPINSGNFKIMYNDYYENGVTPSQTVYDTDKNIVNYVSFISSDYCSNIRDKYKTYENYVKSKMPCYPAPLAGGILNGIDNGKELTKRLVNTKYKTSSLDNSSKPIYDTPYLAAKKCYDINCNHPQLSTGCWFLPTISDMIDLMWDVECNDDNIYTDILSTVIFKLNNTYDSSSILTHGYNFSPMQINDYNPNSIVKNTITCVKAPAEDGGINMNIYAYSDINGINTVNPYLKKINTTPLTNMLVVTPITKIDF